jgi:hypothetical protein
MTLVKGVLYLHSVRSRGFYPHGTSNLCLVNSDKNLTWPDILCYRMHGRTVCGRSTYKSRSRACRLALSQLRILTVRQILRLSKKSILSAPVCTAGKKVKSLFDTILSHQTSFRRCKPHCGPSAPGRVRLSTLLYPAGSTAIAYGLGRDRHPVTGGSHDREPWGFFVCEEVVAFP